MLGNRLTQGRLAHRVGVAQAAWAQGLFAAGDNTIPYRQRKGVQVGVVGAKGAQGCTGFARKWRVGQALARVQRELTKRYFLNNNEKLLITFSAGITEVTADDTQESAVKRADGAMYTAKTTGKNRVVTA